MLEDIGEPPDPGPETGCAPATGASPPAGTRRCSAVIPRGLLAAAIGALVLGASCEYPRDPEGTLQEVSGGVLRVGVGDRPPWAWMDEGQPRGVEVELAKRFAGEIDARIEWVEGAEEELLSALEHHALDLVVAGLSASTKWNGAVGVTRPYAATRIVVGVPRGDAPTSDIEGVRVTVEEGTEAEALLSSEGAVPVPVEEVEEPTGPAAVEDWRLDDLGLRATEVELESEEHVLAVPPGENRFLMRLERFLSQRTGLVRTLLEETEET